MPLLSTSPGLSAYQTGAPGRAFDSGPRSPHSKQDVFIKKVHARL